MKRILTIVGPTASGKTSLTIQLAKLLNGEIISLDSRQIYLGMEIGTAQPTKNEMSSIPHHLLGFRDPSYPISAGEYARLVREKVKEIQIKGKIPIICGGAGLYYRALSKGIFKESVSDLPIRYRLEQTYDDNPNVLYKRLKTIDPDYADIVHINNKKRLVRSLEIYETTGKTPTEHFANQVDNPVETLNLFTILLSWEKPLLAKRIYERTLEMLYKGWIQEVEILLKKQVENHSIYPALNSIGYMQIQAYLSGDITLDDMKEEINIKTRQLGRRQLKWFNKEKINLIIEMGNLDREKISEIIYCFIKAIP